jgi:hypothetical protein
VVTASTSVTVVVTFVVIIVVTVIEDAVCVAAKYDTEVVVDVTIVDGVGMLKHWQADEISFERYFERNTGMSDLFSIEPGISFLFAAVGLV